VMKERERERERAGDRETERQRERGQDRETQREKEIEDGDGRHLQVPWDALSESVYGDMRSRAPRPASSR
jgi:hypothetical protein